MEGRRSWYFGMVYFKDFLLSCRNDLGNSASLHRGKAFSALIVCKPFSHMLTVWILESMEDTFRRR